MTTLQNHYGIKRKLTSVWKVIRRNTYCASGAKVNKHQVNLEWVDNNNLGDELAPVIYNWMLERRKIQVNQRIKKEIHLMTIGSMVGSWNFDAVVWGSGVHLFSNVRKLARLKGFQKFDIRAVRGPVTKSVLKSCGYECPDIYGDPAILMPLIYHPEVVAKEKVISVVIHYKADGQWEKDLLKRIDDRGRSDSEDVSREKYDIRIQLLNIGTRDYTSYIREMLASEKVVSSSLHGIILAEAYGIPAVFLNTGGYVDDALMKYYDWYYSTGRYSVKMARSLQEAFNMEPMPLPDLDEMRFKLIEAFPYDLYSVSHK
ncbi:MAG: polysaccharide pyruvyl transferase family protein [Clostridia bacterium]|nr:polysaccharide pyruvyl transferase family protein [Clostridia bacterium]